MSIEIMTKQNTKGSLKLHKLIDSCYLKERLLRYDYYATHTSKYLVTVKHNSARVFYATSDYQYSMLHIYS